MNDNQTSMIILCACFIAGMVIFKALNHLTEKHEQKRNMKLNNPYSIYNITDDVELYEIFEDLLRHSFRCGDLIDEKKIQELFDLAKLELNFKKQSKNEHM